MVNKSFSNSDPSKTTYCVCIIGTEQDRYKRWIKEATTIRKNGGTTMKRDEGQYFLSHACDEILMKKKLPIGRSTGSTESGNTVARRQSSSVSSR